MGIGIITNISIKHTKKGILMMIILGWNQNISLQIGMRYTPSYDTIQKIWGRYRKIARDGFGRKRKSTGFIYLPG